VDKFGKREFITLIALNFEKNPEYKEIFSSLEPTDILEKIALFIGKKMYYYKMWMDPIISVGYASPMFNTYSISKYFFCFLHFTNVPLKS
jgi:hypothetical protein